MAVDVARKRLAALASVSAIVVAGALAVLPGVAAATTLTSKDCGNVAANSACSTASVSTGSTRCTLFRLVNGPGVNHRAKLFDVFREGTAQDVYSPRVSYGGSISGVGTNLSASAHHYTIYQVTC
jgi:hypothetical protein